MDFVKVRATFAVRGQFVGHDGAAGVLRDEQLTVIESDARWTVEARGQHAPLNITNARILSEGFHPGFIVHDVGGGCAAVVGVDPKHAIVRRVGNVEDARFIVKHHVAGHAHHVADFNFGVAMNDGVGMVIVPGVVVVLEVVTNQLAVIAVVVPVDVVVVVGDANAER